MAWDKAKARRDEYYKFVARCFEFAETLPAPYQEYLATLPHHEARQEAICNIIDNFDVAEELFRGYINLDLLED
jgi:hypothetical protein